MLLVVRVIMLGCGHGHSRHRGLGFDVALGRRSRGGRKGIANRKVHGGDLLLLVHDDLLRNALELLVLAVLEFGHRHLDCALMVRPHHLYEVPIDVAGRRRF